MILRNFEIVQELNKVGIHIRSVQQLRKIMFRLGLIEKFGDTWSETSLGMKYTGCYSPSAGAHAWLPEIVPFLVSQIEDDDSLLNC